VLALVAALCCQCQDSQQQGCDGQGPASAHVPPFLRGSWSIRNPAVSRRSAFEAVPARLSGSASMRGGRMTRSPRREGAHSLAARPGTLTGSPSQCHRSTPCHRPQGRGGHCPAVCHISAGVVVLVDISWARVSWAHSLLTPFSKVRNNGVSVAAGIPLTEGPRDVAPACPAIPPAAGSVVRVLFIELVAIVAMRQGGLGGHQRCAAHQILAPRHLF
jgi:hypothetical protein